MKVNPRRRALVALFLLVCALVASIVLCLVAYQRSPVRDLPYHDAFHQGRADEWKAQGGTWELVNGSMRNDSDERGAKLLTGSTRWRNYSVDADVMLLGLGGDAGLVVRSSDEEQGVDAYTGYYAGLRTIDNSLVLGRAGHGWVEAHQSLDPQKLRLEASRWYHLRLLVFGCQLAATLTIPPRSSSTTIWAVDDACISSGRIGLRSYASGGVWRNVSVQPAKQEDLDMMLATVSVPLATGPAELSTDERSIGDYFASSERSSSQRLPSNPDAQLISALRLAAFTTPVRATVRGIVVLASPALFVEDSTGGLSVQQTVSQPLKVGDEVEVTGDVRANAFSPTVEHATVRVLWEGTPMPAVSVTASQAATGAFDATFIEVQGRLVKKQYGPDDTLLFDFDAGPQSFRAIMNRGRGDYLYSRLKTDSLLRLRGISVSDPAYTHDLVPFALLLRSTDDAVIISGPPWWSAGHLLTLAVTFFLLAMVANFFYHRVENWRLRAVLEERERLAYEMHDTLSQSFAGIGFQLEAIREGINGELPRLHQQLDLARELVRHSHEETRRSITMLRPEPPEGGLLGALTQCANYLVEGGSVQIVARSTGDAIGTSLRVADTLYRIGQEAIANAVRHGHPSLITIRVVYERELLHLQIDDDGEGFTPRDDLQGFGIRGMRKRANSIAAELRIRSTPGEGTHVSVSALLPARVNLTSWPALAFRSLWRSIQNVAASRKFDPNTYRR